MGYLLLSTGGTSTGGPVCLSVCLRNFIEMGFNTPVLSTMCRIWFVSHGIHFGIIRNPEPIWFILWVPEVKKKYFFCIGD